VFTGRISTSSRPMRPLHVGREQGGERRHVTLAHEPVPFVEEGPRRHRCLR
jgi:hypothetical protein